MNRHILTSIILLAGVIRLDAAKVSGTVLDASDKSPLPACAIAILPGQRSVQTDIDGKFVLDIPAGAYTLKASYVGFDDYTAGLKVGARDTSIVIELKPAATSSPK